MMSDADLKALHREYEAADDSSPLAGATVRARREALAAEKQRRAAAKKAVSEAEVRERLAVAIEEARAATDTTEVVRARARVAALRAML
jgi:hypothetical protein